jgi:hypothetical protein
MAEQQDAGAPRRVQQRDQVEVSRPIAVRLLDDGGEPLSAWLVADILDVSVGGLCLLLAQDDSLPLRQLMPLQLDVRNQPGFQRELMGAQLRWFVPSGFVVTLGLVFDTPLPDLPALVS